MRPKFFVGERVGSICDKRSTGIVTCVFPRGTAEYIGLNRYEKDHDKCTIYEVMTEGAPCHCCLESERYLVKLGGESVGLINKDVWSTRRLANVPSTRSRL